MPRKVKKPIEIITASARRQLDPKLTELKSKFQYLEAYIGENCVTKVSNGRRLSDLLTEVGDDIHNLRVYILSH